MTQELAHHPSGSVTLAAALACTAGFVDAHIYVNVTPVFVANMSGNLVHLGIFAGLGDSGDAAASIAVLVAFLMGVVVATRHHDQQLSVHGRLRPGMLIAAEAALIACLPLLIEIFGSGFESHARLADYPIIAVAGFAMGMQTSALRRVGVIAVATTYGTGAVVRIGEKIGLAVSGADKATQHRRRDTIVVLVVVLASYVTGAATAAVLGSSPLLLLIPAAVLVGAAMVMLRAGVPTDA